MPDIRAQISMIPLLLIVVLFTMIFMVYLKDREIDKRQAYCEERDGVLVTRDLCLPRDEAIRIWSEDDV